MGTVEVPRRTDEGVLGVEEMGPPVHPITMSAIVTETEREGTEEGRETTIGETGGTVVITDPVLRGTEEDAAMIESVMEGVDIETLGGSEWNGGPQVWGLMTGVVRVRGPGVADVPRSRRFQGSD